MLIEPVHGWTSTERSIPGDVNKTVLKYKGLNTNGVV
jgi:hypothetical protein